VTTRVRCVLLAIHYDRLDEDGKVTGAGQAQAAVFEADFPTIQGIEAFAMEQAVDAEQKKGKANAS
jgi:hypothetical protein